MEEKEKISNNSLDPSNISMGKQSTEGTLQSSSKNSSFVFQQRRGSGSGLSKGQKLFIGNNNTSQDQNVNIYKIIRDSKLKNPLENSINNKSS